MHQHPFPDALRNLAQLLFRLSMEGAKPADGVVLRNAVIHVEINAPAGPWEDAVGKVRQWVDALPLYASDASKRDDKQGYLVVATKVQMWCEVFRAGHLPTGRQS